MAKVYPVRFTESESSYEAITGVRDKSNMRQIAQFTSQSSIPSLLAQLREQIEHIHENEKDLTDGFLIRESPSTIGVNPIDYRIGGVDVVYDGVLGLNPTNGATTSYWLDASGVLQSSTSGFPAQRNNIMPLGQVIKSGGVIDNNTGVVNWLTRSKHEVSLLGVTGTVLDVLGQGMTDSTQDSIDLGDATTAVKLPSMTDTERDALAAPLAGMVIWNTTSTQLERYDGSSWGAFAGGVTDHGALTGLSDDDHTIYALLAGRSGGQTIKGGTGASEILLLQGTAHATHGGVKIAANNYFDVPELGTPATNPAAGFNRAYFKSDDLLYSLDSEGNEQPINPHSIIDDMFHTDVQDLLVLTAGQMFIVQDVAGVPKVTLLSPGALRNVLGVSNSSGDIAWVQSSGVGSILRESKPNILNQIEFADLAGDPAASDAPPLGGLLYVDNEVLKFRKVSGGITDLLASSAGTSALLAAATHTDTETGTAVRGDIIMANSTPAWARFSKGAAKRYLRMATTGLDPEWAINPGESGTLHFHFKATASAGDVCYIRSPNAAITLTNWDIVLNASGSITLDVWNDIAANYPPTVADTLIGAGTKPFISGATNGSGAVVFDDATVAAKTWIAVKIDSIDTATEAHGTIDFTYD
jgi:hypothetical protein